jgi:ABC-type glycerol-3-phosphate transport system substrate-binding protein
MPFVQGPVANLGSGAAQTLSIPRSSKHQEAAAEFIAWWSRPENVAAICEAAGQVPPSATAVDLLRASVGTSNFWGETLATAKELNGQPYCPGWLPMLGKTWEPAMFNYLRGKSSFDDFAQTVATTGTVDVQTAAGNI